MVFENSKELSIVISFLAKQSNRFICSQKSKTQSFEQL